MIGALPAMFDGDAVQTLRDAPRPVDLEFLDGWKELCLPVLQLVEPSPPPPCRKFPHPPEHERRTQPGIDRELRIGER